MDSSPTGPKGSNRTQPPAAPATDQEAAKRVSVGQKQVPHGQPLDRRALDEWKVAPYNATPVLTKPEMSAEETYQGADAKERVMAMLAGMEPDVNSELIHRVSAECQAEMVERVARIQKALGKQPVQKAFETGILLLDLEEKPPAVDVTLNYVMALALKIQHAQNDIRARINADRGNVEAWKKGLKLFSQVQDAWHELYPIIMDICAHEPAAFEITHAPLERTLSRESIDSGVGDLIDLEDPWNQPQPLPSPQPVSLLPSSEARINELERQLGDTVDHLRYERSMRDRLQESQDKIAALMQANQQVNHDYTELQREVETLRNQPLGADPNTLRRAENQVSLLSHENTELKRQLEWEKDLLKQRISQISSLESSLQQKDTDLLEVRNSRDSDWKQFAGDKQKLERRISELEHELSTAKESVRIQEERVADLEQQLSFKTREYDDLNNQYQALFESRVESGADSQRQLAEQYDHNNSQYEQRFAELTEAFSAAGREKEQLQIDLNESRQREQELDQKVQQLESERETAETIRNELEKEWDSEREEVERLKAELEERELSITALSSEKDNAQVENSTLVESYNKQLKDLEEKQRLALEEREASHVQDLTREQERSAETEERLNKEFNEKIQQEAQKAEDAEALLLSERDEHKAALEALEVQLREQKEAFERQLREKENSHSSEMESLKFNLNTSAEEKDKAHQEEVAGLQDNFESKSTDLKSSIATLEENIQKLDNDHKKEIEDLQLAFDAERQQLIEAHNQALTSKQNKFTDLEEDAQSTEVKFEKEKITLINEHQQALSELEQSHARELADKDEEFTHRLEETRRNLDEAYQEKLEGEKAPLVEDKHRLTSELAQEKKNLAAKEQDISVKKEQMQSLSNELAALKQKLDQQQEQRVKDSEAASQIQAQLRTSLSELDSQKNQVDKELADLQVKLKETESQREKDIAKAIGAEKNLVNSLSELTSEKAGAKKKIDELTKQLSGLEGTLTQKGLAIEALNKERNQLQDKASSLETELDIIKERIENSTGVAVQTSPDAEIMVQEFIDGVEQQRSLSGSTSGVVSDFGENSLAGVDSVVMHSETLYRRPGSKGAGKKLRIEAMLDNSFKRLQALNQTSNHPSSVDIAFQQAIKGIVNEKRELDVELNKLEADESALRNPNEPPSHSPLRQARIKRYELFVNKLESLQQTFQTHVKEERDRQKVQQLSKAMDDYIGAVNFSVHFLKHRDDQFHQLKNEYSQLPQSNVKTPEGRVQDIHTSLQELMKHEDAEVRDYVAGAYVKEAAAEILQRGRDALQKAGGDGIREELVRFETCLKRLTPQELPLKMGAKLGALGSGFILRELDEAKRKLHEGYETALPVSIDDHSGRSESGQVLAKRMIEHPDIRPMVLTLLTSLQEKHEGVATDIDYYSASLVGLNRIRNEFGLVDMPTMEELLNYAVHDLNSQNSLLATEAQKRHGQSAKDKTGMLRKDKMLQLCDEFLKKENSTEAPEFAKVRGQSHDNGVMVVHPHRQVLECFREGGQVFSEEHTRSPETKGRLQVRELSGASGGLLNTFFEKAPGGATQVTNDRANLQCIQIGSPNTQPENIVFKFNARAQCWQVNLGDALWNVDPAFNLDHPNLKIPFEKNVAGVTHRDWIPLKSLSGETAILALRKVPKHGRYFLYQKGHGDTLVPKVIGSSNPEQERVEAQFFYDAALLSATKPLAAKETKETAPVSEQRVVVDEVKRLRGAAPYWLNKELSEQQLQVVFDRASLKVSKKPVRCPVPLQDVTAQLSVMTLEDSPYRQIQKKKQSKAKAASSAGISPDHTGSKLVPYSAELFGQFSVAATFEMVGQHYIEKCREDLKGSDALLEEELRAKDTFRREAFKELTVYKGCELKPNEIQDGARADRRMIEGTPEYSRQILTKVTRVNRDHEMRLAQGLNVECDKLAKTARRNAHESELSAYSDDELLDFMILEFEQGKIPQGLEEETYIKQLTGIILARNDLEQSARLAARLDGLMNSLKQLERDANLKADTPEYIQNCQQWNLEMALLATEQEAIASRLDSYTRTTLDSGTRARMSFECRTRTVLRENQVKEVNEALEQITDAMATDSEKTLGKKSETKSGAENGRMSRVSQLGTGWGKSTVVQPLTDHACAQNMGVMNRSVLVIAPESNQADLNITLGRYYARKGLHYQMLDIENQYVNPASGRRWWSAENLDRIYIAMMGGSPETDMTSLVSRVNEPRAPVGVSVKNVQILMQLRNQLQQQESLNKKDQASLQRLDRIADLVRESMVFFDEWDRTLMPPGADDLKDVTDGVNRALKPLDAEELKPEDIMQCHGQMVQGCKRKHMLSATVGSGYTAAVAAGVTDPADIKEQCHTDVFTTQQRFWHWLNGATPVYVHLNQDDGRELMFRKVIDEVGTDREIIVFDGNHREGDSASQAVNDYRLLSKERQGRGAKTRGVLYYDDKKQLHKYEKNDPVYGVGNGAILPKEEEDFIKANRGRDVDVVLTHRESIGTDAPQGPESVGIYMGLLEQQDDGRSSLAAQQMGRMMRASGDLRKPQNLYVVVNLDAIEQLPANTHEKEQFNAAFEKERKALTQLAKAFECTADRLKPELKALVYTPLQVPPQNAENREDAEALTEQAVNHEVNRLVENDWARHGLSQHQLDALKSFKIQQWQTRKAYLLLTAAELARREVSHHTESCEKTLHKANVESHLDEVFADENAWLQRGMDGRISQCQLTVDGFKDEEIREITRHKIITAVGNELSSIPRRTSTAAGDASRINEQIKPEAMSQEIEGCITRLKEGGIQTKPWQELDEPAYSLVGKDATHVPTIREVLVSESAKAFNEALSRTDQVISNFYISRNGNTQKIKPIGLEQIVALRNDLNKKAQLISEGKTAGVDQAIKTKEAIEHHYQEVMRAISWVGFDGLIVSSGSDCNDAFNRVCNIMRPVIDIPAKRKATGQGVGKTSWEQDERFKGAGLESSFLKNKSFKDAVNHRVKEERTKYGSRGNVSTVYRLAWKEKQSPKAGSTTLDYKSVRPPLSETTAVKPTALSNASTLDPAVSEAKSAMKRQQRSDEAMKLCQRATGTDTALYEACMDEVLQQLLDMYGDYSIGVQEYSHKEQDRIQQQMKLMQVP